jgi:hypothetical protein
MKNKVNFGPTRLNADRTASRTEVRFNKKVVGVITSRAKPGRASEHEYLLAIEGEAAIPTSTILGAKDIAASLLVKRPPDSF